MTVAHARALLTTNDVHLEPYAPLSDLAALRALAHWAIRFAPIVAPDPPDGLLIDVTGCARLYKNEHRLIDLIAAAMERLSVRARIAVAPTFAAAWAVARFGKRHHSIVPAERLREALGPLSVRALHLEKKTEQALHEIAIDRIEHLFIIPRREIPVRFGDALLLRLDQALGQAIETIDAVQPAPPPIVERVFTGPVKQLEAIRITARELLSQLADLLQHRESGVCELLFQLDRSDAETIERLISLSRPSRNVKHLFSLLQPHLEQANLGFGVDQVTLIARRIALLPHEQLPQWSSDRRDVEPADGARLAASLGECLDMYANRLGWNRVIAMCPAESHVPERAVRFAPAFETRATSPDHTAMTEHDRPPLLYHRPEPIDVLAVVPDGPPSWLRWRGRAHRVIHGIGPERIASEWWSARLRRLEASSGPPSTIALAPFHCRNYFRVQLETGRWLWVYRNLLTNRWFIHGAWM